MTRILRALGLAALLLGSTSVSGVVNAQDLRYSWFELGVMGQDVGRTGTSFDPILNQTVDISATDGSGFRFRGSVGTWNNLYALSSCQPPAGQHSTSKPPHEDCSTYIL